MADINKSIGMYYISALILIVVLPISLQISSNNKGEVTEKPPTGDTAYYFNERGNLILKQAAATQPPCFVIKTKQKLEDLYSDFFRSDDFGLRNANRYKPANVRSISPQIAQKVEKLIRRGRIDDSLVLANVVEILTKETLRKMRSTIKGNYNNMADSNNFREYGGLVKDDGTITTFVGEIKYPNQSDGNRLHIIGAGVVEYHSHPAGRLAINEQNKDDILEVIGAKRQKVKTQYMAYIQAPSGIDQRAVGDRIGYVFGMGSRLIYVYDRQGVKATLPLAFAE